ncbi:SDR family NAD(P)-dependent oxidoreductase [Amycolatopsis nigrescens]|uniref:SDR family NAD(P)-dependent oxidoreductase n=1 Tax=Amycolatopsis nigrescens TaxID=381445 RepID=UPI000382267D|nr:SDR family NAD(P)-dependent oxidoreductase [Amycolatopsis nigrescens]
MELEGRVALVTGASGGIGGGIAKRFAEAGARVVVHYRTDADGAGAVVEAIESAGGVARAEQADLREGAEDLVERTVRAYGRLDAVVANAGVQPMTPLPEMTLTEWRAVLEVNLDATFLVLQAAYRRFAAQGDGGAVVAIGSITGSGPKPGHAHYAVSKAAVHMLVRAAAVEYAARGVRVNLVSPGLTWRPGIEQEWPEGVRQWESDNPLHRLGRPSDIADACLFLVSPASSWVTGQELIVDGGTSAGSTW